MAADFKGSWNTRNGAQADVDRSRFPLMPWGGKIIESFYIASGGKPREFNGYWDRDGKSPVTADWDLMEKQTPREQKK